MSDDFDLAHDKLPDLPVTVGGDKSAAAWHPTSGPGVPHADLIAEARDYAEFCQATRHAPPSATRLLLELCDALAALGDTVPREQYDRMMVNADAREQRQREARDEARSERDALAAQLAEVDAAVGDPEHPRFSQPEMRARMHAIVKAATANEDERDRILALHDAEVKAQALLDAQKSCPDCLGTGDVFDGAERGDCPSVSLHMAIATIPEEAN